VPIFTDPRIVPRFRGRRARTSLDNAAVFKWLEANPTRPLGNLMELDRREATHAGCAGFEAPGSRLVETGRDQGRVMVT